MAPLCSRLLTFGELRPQVVLGLAHGLVLLPVVYVLCSPPSTGRRSGGAATGYAVTGADPAAQPGAAHDKSGEAKTPGGSSDAQIELTASTSAPAPNGRDTCTSERFDNPLWRVGAAGMKRSAAVGASD